MEKLYKASEVVKLTGISSRSIYRLMKLGRFPRPIRIEAQTVRWRDSDLERWLAERAAN